MNHDLANHIFQTIEGGTPSDLSTQLTDLAAGATCFHHIFQVQNGAGVWATVAYLTDGSGEAPVHLPEVPPESGQA